VTWLVDSSVVMVAAKTLNPCTFTYDRPLRSNAYCRRLASTECAAGLSESGVRSESVPLAGSRNHSPSASRATTLPVR
jgi:hypothetical protein